MEHRNITGHRTKSQQHVEQRRCIRQPNKQVSALWSTVCCSTHHSTRICRATHRSQIVQGSEQRESVTVALAVVLHLAVCVCVRALTLWLSLVNARSPRHSKE